MFPCFTCPCFRPQILPRVPNPKKPQEDAPSRAEERPSCKKIHRVDASRDGRASSCTDDQGAAVLPTHNTPAPGHFDVSDNVAYDDRQREVLLHHAGRNQSRGACELTGAEHLFRDCVLVPPAPCSRNGGCENRLRQSSQPSIRGLRCPELKIDSRPVAMAQPEKGLSRSPFGGQPAFADERSLRHFRGTHQRTQVLSVSE